MSSSPTTDPTPAFETDPVPIQSPANDAHWEVAGTSSHHATRVVQTVMAADVAGYTALMEADEDDTHARLMRGSCRSAHPTAVWGSRAVRPGGYQASDSIWRDLENESRRQNHPRSADDP
jgi:hypothetical protein